MTRLNLILLWLAVLALAFSTVIVVACGDDDDDDDNDDEETDDDDSENSCYDDLQTAADAACDALGLTAQSGGGLDYSYAECGVACANGAFYDDTTCEKSYCVCCE